MMEEEIANRVAASPLVTFDLEDYFLPGERILFDIKEVLYEGLVLREKEFRAFVQSHDWQQYQNKCVAITCSTDAIVPVWAYMLISISLEPFVRFSWFGTLDELETQLFLKSLSNVAWDGYAGKKVVIKGCSRVRVPETIYVAVASLLKPYVDSLMYGEPCSTVPLLKKRKK